MKCLSIRWKLTLWYAAALTVVLTLFCLVLLTLARQLLLGRLDAALREELRELVLEVELARSDQEFTDHVRARFFRHDVYDFLIADSQGQILFFSSGITPAHAKSILSAKLTEDLVNRDRDVASQQPVRVAGKILNRPTGSLSVYAVTSLGPLNADLSMLRLLMLCMLPASILVALGGGYFLATRALAPVEKIARVAESITISNLSQRIEVGPANDELGHLASTLNSLIARLQRAVEEIQQFTADASHELRTPLSVLRLEAEAALQRVRSPEEYQQTLLTVLDEAKRLGRLADQLLVLSRHDAGLTECRRETVRLDALVRDAIEHLAPLAEERQIELCITAIRACEVVGDDLMLSQAISNVLDNAIRYTPPGGTITVRCDVFNHSITLRIQDNGIGIPAEHLEKVFDRFYRVDSSRGFTTGGAGLGLSITRTAVQLHAGSVEIASDEGVGTTLTVRLPGEAVAEIAPAGLATK